MNQKQHECEESDLEGALRNLVKTAITVRILSNLLEIGGVHVPVLVDRLMLPSRISFQEIRY